MPTKNIRVVATVIALANKTTEVQAILLEIVAPTRRETDCLNYQLFRNSSNPAEFLFIEERVDEKVIDAHSATPHAQQALTKVTPLLTLAPHIQKYALLA